MYFAEKFGMWIQEKLEIKVKEQLEAHKNVQLAACEVAGELARMGGSCDPEIELDSAEIDIERDIHGNEMLSVTWWQFSCGDRIEANETFPLSYLWDFDWREKKQKQDMDIQLERLKKLEKEKQARRKQQREDRKALYKQLRQEFGDE